MKNLGFQKKIRLRDEIYYNFIKKFSCIFNEKRVKEYNTQYIGVN